LHATKLYHSTEGGLIVTKNKKLHDKLKSMRNFGFSSFVSFSELGINGKNSEFHAAMGLCNLKYIDQIHLKRKTLTEHYDKHIKKLNHRKQSWRKDSSQNYAYYPILLENETVLKKHIDALELHEIFTRRYYYPSLANSLPYLEKENFEVTDDISSRILCLPLYHDLSLEEVEMICKIMLETQSNL
jgi:dTDP-4-amino-4,6-dideoxygalactose transaminase